MWCRRWPEINFPLNKAQGSISDGRYKKRRLNATRIHEFTCVTHHFHYTLSLWDSTILCTSFGPAQFLLTSAQPTRVGWHAWLCAYPQTHANISARRKLFTSSAKVGLKFGRKFYSINCVSTPWYARRIQEGTMHMRPLELCGAMWGLSTMREKQCEYVCMCVWWTTSHLK